MMHVPGTGTVREFNYYILLCDIWLSVNKAWKVYRPIYSSTKLTLHTGHGKLKSKHGTLNNFIQWK